MGQILKAEQWLRKKGRAAAFRNAITFVDPDNVYIDEEVEIGDGTEIWPNVHIIGEETKPAIGRKCKIGPGVIITDCQIGDGVKIGPAAKLKRTVVGDRTKIPHDCYFADATIGEETNIGYNSGTSNFDGWEKLRTVIGPRCFIGTFVDFIAPITIGAECYIASRPRLSIKVPTPPHCFVFEEIHFKGDKDRVGRPHITWKKNCSFKVPDHWKWIWTHKPIDPERMKTFFDILSRSNTDYTQWLNTPSQALSGDKPREVIKKHGEEDLAMILALAKIDLNIPEHRD